MRQASHSWQELIQQLSVKRLKLPRGKSLREPGGILGFLTVVIAMLLWNWKLLLASAVGVSSMTLVYSMQGWNWQKFWSGLHNILSSPNRRLLLAVVSGGISTFCTYLSAVILVESNNVWIAVGAILQGLATLLVLFLLACHIHSLYYVRQEKQIDRLVLQLTSQEPLKRLVAVSQLSKLAYTNDVDPSLKKNITDLLRLLLLQETEKIVQESALEGLQKLDNSTKLHSVENNKPIPISLKAKRQEVLSNYL
ncbi:MAG: armadillo-type fold-containing protein [Cyanobacteria bacterium P01_A01_bin.45]